MKAYQVEQAGQALTLRDLPEVEPKGAEVVLKTVACGVCHSDLHLQEGGFHLGGDKRLDVATQDRTLGHEVIGVVLAKGPEAEGVEVGDKRVLFPWIGCGECPICRRGDEHICRQPSVIGIEKDGGFAEQVLVPHPRYLFDKGDVPDTLAATYACSGLTAYSAMKKVGDLQGGDLLIIGLGGVGMMAFEMAVSIFGFQPIVVDIDDHKLELAKQHGAKAAFNAKEKSTLKQIMGLTDGGAYKAIDFVGSEQTASMALRALQKGGQLISIGLYGGELRFPLPMIPIMERGIQGSYVGNLETMKELMTLVREGKAPAIPIDERQFDQCNQALSDLRDGKVEGRVVLRISE